ncbi:unnamed protein product [Calicophoron daubneyi]|uniref:von Hippel-Lindau disease tumour suppressor beta domain-containing protein n=1 Tax=Calicophoron daubneyi TaxID=300641 RepID=A0AAV2TUX5_CALDB
MESLVKSADDNVPVTINFFNSSAWNSLLLWCDYEGRRVLYASVGPGRSCCLYSFLTHPWIALDSTSFTPMTLSVTQRQYNNTSESIVCAGLSVFTPAEEHISAENPGTIYVSIHLPVLSLAELCKRVVQTSLLPESVRQTELPHYVVNYLLRPVLVPWHRLATNRS